MYTMEDTNANLSPPKQHELSQTSNKLTIINSTAVNLVRRMVSR